ncbi:hypothetical protein [Cyanobium sp. BA5m-21]|nr:hypothetical protein [Cyanobium sp. BA5m-21]
MLHQVVLHDRPVGAPLPIEEIHHPGVDLLILLDDAVMPWNANPPCRLRR